MVNTTWAFPKHPMYQHFATAIYEQQAYLRSHRITVIHALDPTALGHIKQQLLQLQGVVSIHPTYTTESQGEWKLLTQNLPPASSAQIDSLLQTVPKSNPAKFHTKPHTSSVIGSPSLIPGSLAWLSRPPSSVSTSPMSSPPSTPPPNAWTKKPTFVTHPSQSTPTLSTLTPNSEWSHKLEALETQHNSLQAQYTSIEKGHQDLATKHDALESATNSLVKTVNDRFEQLLGTITQANKTSATVLDKFEQQQHVLTNFSDRLTDQQTTLTQVVTQFTRLQKKIAEQDRTIRELQRIAHPIHVQKVENLHKNLKSDLKTWNATKFERATLDTELKTAFASIDDKIDSLHHSLAVTNKVVVANRKSFLALKQKPSTQLDDDPLLSTLQNIPYPDILPHTDYLTTNSQRDQHQINGIESPQGQHHDRSTLPSAKRL